MKLWEYKEENQIKLIYFKWYRYCLSFPIHFVSIGYIDILCWRFLNRLHANRPVFHKFRHFLNENAAHKQWTRVVVVGEDFSLSFSLLLSCSLALVANPATTTTLANTKTTRLHFSTTHTACWWCCGAVLAHSDKMQIIMTAINCSF